MAATYAYFHWQHGIEDFKGFWHTSFNGQNPLEHIKKKKLAAVKNSKIQQILIKKHDIRKDISFSGFRQEWANENKRGKVAVDNKQVIFGPVAFQEYIPIWGYKVFLRYAPRRVECSIKIRQICAMRALRLNKQSTSACPCFPRIINFMLMNSSFGFII